MIENKTEASRNLEKALQALSSIEQFAEQISGYAGITGRKFNDLLSITSSNYPTDIDAVHIVRTSVSIIVCSCNSVLLRRIGPERVLNQGMTVITARVNYGDNDAGNGIRLSFPEKFPPFLCVNVV